MWAPRKHDLATYSFRVVPAVVNCEVALRMTSRAKPSGARLLKLYLNDRLDTLISTSPLTAIEPGRDGGRHFCAIRRLSNGTARWTSGYAT